MRIDLDEWICRRSRHLILLFCFSIVIVSNTLNYIQVMAWCTLCTANEHDHQIKIIIHSPQSTAHMCNIYYRLILRFQLHRDIVFNQSHVTTRGEQKRDSFFFFSSVEQIVIHSITSRYGLYANISILHTVVMVSLNSFVCSFVLFYRIIRCSWCNMNHICIFNSKSNLMVDMNDCRMLEPEFICNSQNKTTKWPFYDRMWQLHDMYVTW